MNLENSVSDIETCTLEKVAVAFKWEPGKDVKTDTNMQMKKYPIQDLRWSHTETNLKKKESSVSSATTQTLLKGIIITYVGEALT